MRRHADYENMVAAYHLLSPAERRELEAHVRDCPACTADLAAYCRLDAELRRLPEQRVRPAVWLRVSEALSGADAVANPSGATARARLAPPEPQPSASKPLREPWAWSRLLLPATFALLFIVAVALSLPRGGDPGAVESQPVAAPQQQAAIVKLTFSCDEVGAYVSYTAWAKALAEFEAENPDIQVELRPSVIAVTAQTTHEEAVDNAAKRFDVFCIMPTLTDLQRGVVADLAPFIANDPSFRPDDFYPGLLKTWEENGAVLSVPTYFRPALMHYRPELFDQVGAAHPWPGWTWNEFLATAKALTRRNDTEVTQWGYYEVGGLLFSARLLSGWSPDLQTAPDYATMADILRWYEKLYVEEPASVVPASLRQAAGEQLDNRALEQMLNDGKVAMSDAGWLDDRSRPHLAPYPDSPHGFYVSRMSDLVMSGQTAHPDAAWRLLSYLSQHLPDGEVPARRPLAEKASFWTRLDESSTAAYRYALDHIAAGYPPVPAEYQYYWAAVSAVARGEKTAEQALAELDAQVQLRRGPTERAAAAEATAVPKPAPGQPVSTEHVTATDLVQEDGEGLEDFLARIAVVALVDAQANALIVQVAAEEPNQPHLGVSTRLGARCWQQIATQLQACASAAVVQAIAEATAAGRPVVLFAVMTADDQDMTVRYDVQRATGPDGPIVGYRVVIKLQDAKWRVESVQKVD